MHVRTGDRLHHAPLYLKDFGTFTKKHQQTRLRRCRERADAGCLERLEAKDMILGPSAASAGAPVRLPPCLTATVSGNKPLSDAGPLGAPERPRLHD